MIFTEKTSLQPNFDAVAASLVLNGFSRLSALENENHGSLLAAELALDEFNDNKDKYGLLSVPDRYTQEHMVALEHYHRRLASYDGHKFNNTYYFDLAAGKSDAVIINEVVDENTGLSVKVQPLEALTSQQAAAFVHTQTSAYEGKDTLGNLPTTRKRQELAGFNIVEPAKSFERKLISEMIAGWSADDLIAMLYQQNSSGIVVLAGGVIKFGTSSKNLSEILATNSASQTTLPTFQALNIVRQSDSLADIYNQSEKNIANATRTFSISALGGDRVEQLDMHQYVNDFIPAIIAYFACSYDYSLTKRQEKVNYILSDTHLSLFLRFLVNQLDGRVVAKAGAIQPRAGLNDSVHYYHYDYWLREKQKVTVSVVPPVGHLKGARAILAGLNAKEDGLRWPQI